MSFRKVLALVSRWVLSVKWLLPEAHLYGAGSRNPQAAGGGVDVPPLGGLSNKLVEAVLGEIGIVALASP